MQTPEGLSLEIKQLKGTVKYIRCLCEENKMKGKGTAFNRAVGKRIEAGFKVVEKEGIDDDEWQCAVEFMTQLGHSSSCRPTVLNRNAIVDWAKQNGYPQGLVGTYCVWIAFKRGLK